MSASLRTGIEKLQYFRRGDLRNVAQLHKNIRMIKTAELLTASEVADQLHLHVATVNRMAADGRLAPVKKLPGKTGAYLFDPADVEVLSGALKATKATK